MIQEIKNLGQLYSTDNRPRYLELAKRFEELYGTKPTFFARAPGRVNIIGEHIDYMGYGVLPFALEKDCLIAVLVEQGQSQFSVAHLDPSYPSQTFEFSAQPVFKDNYIKFIWAGIQGAGIPTNIGMKWLVSGNVPVCSGLSSSSSLVVCSGFATVTAQNLHPEPKELVETLIKFERLAGTACGGMDQTISALGKVGQALYIEFEPLRLTQVKLPKGFKFVIANSLTTCDKMKTLGSRFNLRVCECRIALALICRHLNLPFKGLTTLAQLQQQLNLGFETMTLLTRQTLEDEYSLAQIEDVLGTSLSQLLSDIPFSNVVLEENKVFLPCQRAVHVFEEAHRVIKFKEICNSPIPDTLKASLLGTLMNQSQESCARLYQCSSERIDQVTKLALQLGALGSRLTGAGWGGCTVSLVKEEEAESFVTQLREAFLPEQQSDETTFVSQPSHGAVTFPYEVINEQNNLIFN